MSLSLIVSRLSGDAAVTGVVSNRIYPDWLPEQAATPAITVLDAGDAPVNNLSGEANLKNERYQIDIWARTLAEADDLRKKVQAAMAAAGPDFMPVRNSRSAAYEDAVTLHRFTLDYSIWFTE